METGRFNRNILIEGLGEEGQRKLNESRVLVVGAGGLGSPVLYYLAAAGIGTLGIIDYDVVEITNLQRQILHNTQDLGKSKVLSATTKLKALYPDLNVEGFTEKLTPENAGELISTYDFVVECCDNYQAKFLINDVCVEKQKPYSHAAVLSLQGEVMTYLPGHACYRCVFGDQPEQGTMPTSAEVGILGSVAGIVGSLQATEVIKYITGLGSLLTDRLLLVDAVSMVFQTVSIQKEKNCICVSGL